MSLLRRNVDASPRQPAAGGLGLAWCQRFGQPGVVPRLPQELLALVLGALEAPLPPGDQRLTSAAHALGVLRAQQGTHTVCLVEDVVALRPVLAEAAAALPGAGDDAGLHLLLHLRATQVLDVVLQAALDAYVEESQAVLRVRATRDALTGLLNRAALLEALQHEVAACEREDAPAVLLLDLDDFKQVNDTRGHLAGDEVLVRVARLLESCARRGDVVARLGGDEFAVVLPRTSRARGQRLAERVIERAEASALGVGLSVGVAWLRRPTSAIELLGEADAAMYDAKRSGGSGLRVRAGGAP